MAELIKLENIDSNRRPWKWTPLQQQRADMVGEVVDELKQYWPLTLRQIFYRLVGKDYIENTQGIYNQISKLVKWMRIEGVLQWEVLEDRVRYITDRPGYEDLEEFIDNHLYWFLENYSRCLIQGQAVDVELWIEKDALFKLFNDVARKYCIRTVVCRGYKSVTFIANYYMRAKASMKAGLQPIVLYFGDLDPSGWQMFEASIETLETELFLSGVEYWRVALNPDQVKQYELPHNPKAIKIKDKRTKKYVKWLSQQGYDLMAVEIDALHPADLAQMVEAEIRKHIDVELYDIQQDIEQHDLAKAAQLKKVKNRVKSELKKILHE